MAQHCIQRPSSTGRGLAGGDDWLHGPFDAGISDAQLASDGLDIAYTAGINFFWTGLMTSITPHVPLYRERVQALSQEIFKTPGVMKWPMVVTINFVGGAMLRWLPAFTQRHPRMN